MIYNLFLQHPHLWVLAAGMCAGGALSSLTRRPSRARDPEKARERKGFAAVLAVTLSVIFILCAVFIPGPEKILDTSLLILFLIATAVCFLAFRFRKAAGLPILLLAGGLVLAVVLFFQAVTAFTGETEVGLLRVKETDGRTINFSLTDASGATGSYLMPGTMLGVEMKEIIFDDLFVFFGVKTAYRFLGIKSATINAGSEMTQELRAVELPRPRGISEALYRLVEANTGIIPGVKTAQTQITYIRVKPGAVYSIRVQHDSGTEIMQVNMEAQ
jgi:hypothetical protein